MFHKYDKNGDGQIDIEEFTRMLVKLGLAPQAKKNKNLKEPDV
jgi:Ca2+-binding EF-hand superfamily protein